MACEVLLEQQFDTELDPGQLSDWLRTMASAPIKARSRHESLAALLEQNAFALSTHPTRVVAPLQREPKVPYMDFAPLDNALVRLKKSAQVFDKAYGQIAGSDLKLDAARRIEPQTLLHGLE